MPIQDNRHQLEEQERSLIGEIQCKYCVKDTIAADYLLRYSIDRINPFEEWRVPALQVALAKAQMQNDQLISALQNTDNMLRLAIEGNGSIDLAKLMEM